MNKWITKNGYIIYQVLSGRSNVFLVSNGSNCILVDTSVNNKWRSLNEGIERVCSSNMKLAALILTHAHFDHAANALKVKKKYNVTVIVHKDEADYLTKGKTSLPKGTIFLTKWFDVFGELAARLVKYAPVNYDILVDDSYEMNDFGPNISIVHTPGHTTGSISIIIDDEIAIVGDTMFGILKGSVFPPFADEPKLMINSWKRLLDTGCKFFLPSHGTANSRELLLKQFDKYRKVYNV
jgi:glyoxylase-like metal-dependent hydrolase (beta-lactamase superfamily II)